MSERIEQIFGVSRALVGVLHLPALPGTPRSRLGMRELVAAVLAEARELEGAGFHGLIMENMHDRPYLKGAVGPEIVAAMAIVGREVRETVALPLGVQVLAGANREAVAVAHACGAAFVRVEGLVFGHVADEGWIDACAGDLLRYRRTIDAEGVAIFADVKKKHAAHAATADVDLVETAKAAELFLADGLVVTGSSTGVPASATELGEVKRAVGLPVLVGSGITPGNLGEYGLADAWIVGSCLKQDGLWSNPLLPERCDAMVRAMEALPPPEPAGRVSR